MQIRAELREVGRSPPWAPTLVLHFPCDDQPRLAFALLHKSCFNFRDEFLRPTQELRDLYDKVAAGERISEVDALRLFESKDLNAPRHSDLARQKKVGNRASLSSIATNYSNYCILSCQFCLVRAQET